MKKLYGAFFTVLSLFFSHSAFAQDTPPAADSTHRDKEYANPSVEGTPRGRFLVFRYDRKFSYDFNSTGTDKLPVGHRDARMKHSNISEIKGYIPVWNRPHLKMVLGVGYEREEFNFKGQEGYNTDYAFHRNLQDKGLKSLSAQLAVLHPVDYNNYWVVRLKGQLNGDYTSDELSISDYFRGTAELLYGWKKSKDFSWGVGAQAGYTFGRFSVYPAILYNRTFNNPDYGVEAIFPATALFRYRQSASSYFYTGYNLEGYSYIIKVDKPPFTSTNGTTPFQERNLKTVELRHQEVKLKLRWEREIYDFIWFSLEGGYRINVSYDTFEEGSKRKVTLIETDAGSAPYALAELYFVVPRKLMLKR